MLDAIIISDLHLGSDICQAKPLISFLEKLHEETIKTKKLILNGDVFDSIDFRRLRKHHWKVLSLLRKLSKKLEVIWIEGNHDSSAEFVSHLLGVDVRSFYIFTTGAHRTFVTHGHFYDQFCTNRPYITWFADLLYKLLQKIDKTHRIARFAKQSSKTFLRCTAKVAEGAIEEALSRYCTVAICGHTHHPIEEWHAKIRYFNSGSWTELPCTYLAVAGGQVVVEYFDCPVETKI